VYKRQPVDIVNRVRSRINAFAIRRFDRVLFPSAKIRAIHSGVCATYGDVRSLVWPLGWPLPSGDFSGSRDTAHPVEFLYLGKLSEEKGLLDLLEAWRLGVPNSTLVLAGKGPLEGDDRFDLPALTLRGWVEGGEKRRLLAESDVVVVPSRLAETFSLIAAEAVISGKPLICSSLGAPSYVGEFDVGLVYPVGDVESLHRAMCRMAENRLFRVRLKRNTRDVADFLDWSNHVKRFETLYEEIVGLRAAR
jgi:glycosyltransferase involved in cell wall biosynthesis